MCSVFEMALEEKFEIVTSFAMIHHTADPKSAFRKIADRVVPGGLLVIAAGERLGFFQRQLQRFLIHSIAGLEDDDLKSEVATILFKEHLERSVKASGRSIKAAINDTYLNPHYGSISYHDMEGLASRGRISSGSILAADRSTLSNRLPVCPGYFRRAKLGRSFAAFLDA